MDTEWDGLTRGLLLDETLDVDNILEAVDGGDLSFAGFAGSTDNENLIILPDWDGANLIIMLDTSEIHQHMYIHHISHGVPC